MNSSGMHESTGRDPWRSPRPPRHQGVAGRVLLVVLLAGLFILPFSGAGRRLKEGTIEVIRAAQGAPMGGAVASKEAAPAPPPQVIIQEKIVYRDPPPPPLVKARGPPAASVSAGITVKGGTAVSRTLGCGVRAVP